MKKTLLSNDQFDTIIHSRLFAEDFAQPVRDDAFFKNKAVSQIESSIKAIGSASSAYEFNIAVAQANAFISAAHDYEFIDLAEKVTWTQAVWKAVRAQKVLEA
ncbi:hypothetical protein F975_01788 [Acinetobacter sp. ANC 3789]|uniref:hypothetical protein n=1 Tax=Acinetobacter sp. ANC 3789 TaxID=1217714 RepID=UPI0002D0F35F|nr:hypothetical protein [Acinetobacter sp. ANC 3789]ENU80036.1 hypothetical protein F975_01788 [Acinetobacter sp. ANC 3789]